MRESDVLSSTSAVDWKTGKTIKVPLNVPRLRPATVPSLLSNCPTYLSSLQSIREGPLEKTSRIEAEALHQVILESSVTATEQNNKLSFFKSE